MFMGILIPAILLFVVYQLIFNPLDLIHDPWDAGGLKIGILVGIPSAIVGAILVWWHGRRKNDGK